MEILTRLENRIDEILTRVKELEAENARLKRELENGAAELETENLRLQDELDREKAAKEAVVARIDHLLKKLAGETRQENEKTAEAEVEKEEQEEFGFGFAPDTE
jgi:cell division protein ZapB